MAVDSDSDPMNHWQNELISNVEVVIKKSSTSFVVFGNVIYFFRFSKNFHIKIFYQINSLHTHNLHVNNAKQVKKVTTFSTSSSRVPFELVFHLKTRHEPSWIRRKIIAARFEIAVTNGLQICRNRLSNVEEVLSHHV